jgi:NAD(P)-dependent dehydrogenase (short-subunit alcohol dehydrogenase family)
MQPGIEGKIAIVTGSANGIGKETARALAKNGAVVVISDVKVDAGEATAAELGMNFIPCDVSDPTQVRTLVASTVERFGRLDIMVNNAGINTVSQEERVTVDSYSDDTWHRIIDIDLHGAFYCCKAAAAQMIEQKSGSIINVSSVAGIVALRLQIGFVAAKAAVIKMTEAMAAELGPLGIRVNTVSPGSTLTDGTRTLFYSNKEVAERLVSFIPQRRPGDAKEIADAVAFLASDAASYINGHNLIVDGGWTCGFNRDF